MIFPQLAGLRTERLSQLTRTVHINRNNRSRTFRYAAAALLPVLWFQVRPWRPCSPADTAAVNVPEDGLTLLDASRLKASNLTARKADRYTFPYVLRAADRVIPLDSLLLEPARNRRLTWALDGAPLPDARLALKCGPGENHVAVHRISVTDTEGFRDEFTLVAIPSSTARSFDNWLHAERNNDGWIEELPPVYSALLPGGRNPEPEACNPRLWPVLRKVSVQYHPGAAYEMRSAIRADGSGHQATYDAKGNLLRQGASAGSADRSAPRQYNVRRLLAHRDNDVVPFVWAAQLDGNPVNPRAFYTDLDVPLLHEGNHLQAYMEVRPTFDPARREIAPGACAYSRPSAIHFGSSSRHHERSQPERTPPHQ